MISDRDIVAALTGRRFPEPARPTPKTGKSLAELLSGGADRGGMAELIEQAVGVIRRVERDVARGLISPRTGRRHLQRLRDSLTGAGRTHTDRRPAREPRRRASGRGVRLTESRLSIDRAGVSLREAMKLAPDAKSPSMLPGEMARQRDAQAKGKLAAYLAQRKQVCGF
jgi:hypothetical protein